MGFIKMKKILLVVLVLLFWNQQLMAQPVETVEPGERCAVCGMYVAKYPDWVTQLNGSLGTLMFDGVKDMMAYFHEPEKYGGMKGENIRNIYVKDYYSQKWIDGTTALYVTGSDVLGPMGHEFIPFSSVEAAENFIKDHKGKKMITFDEITLELVKKMKGNHKMKHKKMKS